MNMGDVENQVDIAGILEVPCRSAHSICWSNVLPNLRRYRSMRTQGILSYTRLQGDRYRVRGKDYRSCCKSLYASSKRYNVWQGLGELGKSQVRSALLYAPTVLP